MSFYFEDNSKADISSSDLVGFSNFAKGTVSYLGPRLRKRKKESSISLEIGAKSTPKARPASGLDEGLFNRLEFVGSKSPKPELRLLSFWETRWICNPCANGVRLNSTSFDAFGCICPTRALISN